MSSFRDMSIRFKLVAMQLLTALVVLTLYGVFAVINETRLHGAALMRKCETLVQMLATNCTSPLDFLDVSSAEEVLSSASADEDVVNAWIYNADGVLFARYSRPGSPVFDFPLMEAGVSKQERGFVTISKRIAARGETIGIVSLRLNTGRLQAVLVRSGIMATCTLVIGMSIAFLFSILLQKTISAPVYSLVDVVKRVSETGDYTIRVNTQRDDEIGVLCDGFDEMLRRIHEREEQRYAAEAALRKSEQKYRCTAPGSLDTGLHEVVCVF